MPLAAGTRLGSYEILGLLGAGGMGEVHRAHDPRLGRDVALKILLEEAEADESGSARLIREARTAATLSHPNICTIFEVGQDTGRVFLAMELVEGRTLEQRIGGQPLPLESVIRYGAQIADALAHAHDRHVIHRDLKSGNVVITPEGRVKVLDFGLARRVWDVDDEERPRWTLTETGAIVGTPSYLAPEVLRGQKADARADLWALGIVLYEMASGTLPFRGTTTFELASAILNDMPPPLPRQVPAGLRTVVMRCLAKEPGERYERASEVRAALEALHSDSAVQVAAVSDIIPAVPSRVAVERPAARRRVIQVALVVVVLASISLAGWWGRRWMAPKRAPKLTQLTTNSTENPVLAAAISPDGTRLVFADAGGLYLREMATGQTQTIPLPQNAVLERVFLQWFPKGDRIAASFAKSSERTGPGIWAISLVGWEPRKLCDRGEWPVISPDGSRIIYAERDDRWYAHLWIMGATGEDPRPILAGDSISAICDVAWSPDGRHLAVIRVDRKPFSKDAFLQTVLRMEMESGVTDTIVRTTARLVSAMVFWPGPGRVLFTAKNPSPEPGEDLWQVSVPPRGRTPRAPPRRVTSSHFDGFSQGIGSASTDGRRLSFLDARFSSDIFVARLDADRSISDARRLTLDDEEDYLCAWSRDGQSLLFDSNRTGQFDVWEQAVDSKTAHQVFPDRAARGQPYYVQGGAAILHWDGEYGEQDTTRLVVSPRTGGRPRTVLEASGRKSLVIAEQADTVVVLLEWTDRRATFILVHPERGRVRVIGSREVAALSGLSWRVSYDGRHVLMVRLEKVPQIHVLDVATGQWSSVLLRLPPEFAGANFWASTCWDRNGKGFFLAPERAEGVILYSDLQGNTRVVYRAPYRISTLHPSPDGKRIAFMSYLSSTNAWMLENF